MPPDLLGQETEADALARELDADRATVLAMLAPAWREAFEPPEHLSVSAWAERHRRLSSRAAAMPGRWSNERVPYLAEIMDACSQPGVRTVTVAAAAQCGKTSVWENALMWRVCSRPTPSLIVFPSKEMAGSVNTERLLEHVKASPEVARRLTGRARDEKTLTVRFDRMDLWLAGSNSEGSVATRSIGFLVLDEIEKYVNRGTIELARRRTATFAASLIFQSSTRGDEVSEDDDLAEQLQGIETEFLKGDRRRYHCPCPRCGAYQPLTFAGVKWEGGLEADGPSAARSAWYECLACKGRIAQTEKPWMLRRGCWMPDGVEPDQTLPVADAEAVRAAALPHADPGRWRPRTRGAWPATDHRSYEIPGVLSPFVAWGQLAKEFIAQGGKPTREWITEALGEPWRTRRAATTEATLLRYAAEDAARFAHVREWKRGTVPDGLDPRRQPLVLTGAIDVQQDVVYYEVAAWGTGEECWLVDWGDVACPMLAGDDDARAAALQRVDERDRSALAADPWMLVAQLLGREYPSLATGEPMRARCWVVDCGFRTKEVADFCRRMGPDVRAVRGVDSERMVAPYRATTEGVVEYLEINSLLWKNDTHARMHRRPPVPGCTWWPADLSKAWARQATAEELVEERVRGRVVKRWKLRTGRRDNHWWDCRVYNYAQASYLGLALLTPEEARGVREAAERAARPQTSRDKPANVGFALRRPR